jgi:hypothetical protein
MAVSELFEECLHLIPDPAIDHHPAFLRDNRSGRIVETTMQRFCGPEKHRACLPGVVAYGDDAIKLLSIEFLDAFSSGAG